MKGNFSIIWNKMYTQGFLECLFGFSYFCVKILPTELTNRKCFFTGFKSDVSRLLCQDIQVFQM